MPSHSSTVYGNNGYVQIGGGLTTCTNALDCGSGAGRTIIVSQFRRIDRAIAVQSVTLGGEAMTVLGSDQLLSGNYYTRSFALVNPTVEGVQDLVITCTTNGSSSVGETVMTVIADSDTAAAEADLLTLATRGTLTTPWTADITGAIPSATDDLAVVHGWFMSNDVSYAMLESGFTERRWNGAGGIYHSMGDAAGAATVNIAWTPNGVGLDVGWNIYGLSIGPPVAGGVPLGTLRTWDVRTG